MRSLVLERLFLVAACLAVAVFAGRFLLQEAQGAQRAALDPARVYLEASTKAPQLPRPRSWARQQMLLKECDDLLASPFARLSAPVAVERVVGACSDLASDVLGAAPTSSIAHLVHARALGLQNADDDALQAFVKAWTFAKSEGWLAARRLRFGLALVGEGQPVDMLDTVLTADVLLVLGTSRYRSFLADIYETNPNLRGWLSDAMTEASDFEKRRFLEDVRERRQARVLNQQGASND
jgi:hypothetical protein